MRVFGLIVLGIMLLGGVLVGVSRQSTMQTAVAFPPSPADECVVDIEKYNALRLSMPLERVVEIIGCEGVTMSEGGLPGYPEFATVIYRWTGKHPPANAVVMFQGGKLMSKSQFGL